MFLRLRIVSAFSRTKSTPEQTMLNRTRNRDSRPAQGTAEPPQSPAQRRPAAVAPRSNTAPRTPVRTASPNRAQAGVLTGRAALQALEHNAAAREAKRNRPFIPYRFWLTAGESREVIILNNWIIVDDSELQSGDTMGVLMREHTIRDGAGKIQHEACLVQWGVACPFCREHGDMGSHIPKTRLLISIFDTAPYTDGKGVRHEHGGRRILAIPETAVDRWLEIQTAVKDDGENMYGLKIRLKRGTDDKSVAVGEPVNMGSRMYEYLDLEDMRRRYGHPEVRSTQDRNRVIKRADEDLEPADLLGYYEVIAQEQQGGGSGREGSMPLPGSSEEEQEMLAGDADQDDEIPMEHPETDRPALRGRPAPRGNRPAPARPR